MTKAAATKDYRSYVGMDFLATVEWDGKGFNGVVSLFSIRTIDFERDSACTHSHSTREEALECAIAAARAAA